MTRRGTIATRVCALAVAACGQGPIEGGRAGGDAQAMPCDAPVASLRIDPPASRIDVGDAFGSSVQFRALARFADGAAATAPAQWSIEPSGVGTIGPDGVFSPSGLVGAVATVTGRAQGIETTATIEIKWVKEIDLSEGDGLREVFAAYRPRDSGPTSLKIVAPEEGYQVPSPATSLRVEWEGHGHVGYRLLLVSATSEISVLTHESAIQLEPHVVDALARSNVGRAVHLVLEAAGDSGTIHRSRRRTVQFCADVELCNSQDDDCDGYIDNECRSDRQPFTDAPGVAACE